MLYFILLIDWQSSFFYVKLVFWGESYGSYWAWRVCCVTKRISAHAHIWKLVTFFGTEEVWYFQFLNVHNFKFAESILSFCAHFGVSFFLPIFFSINNIQCGIFSRTATAFQHSPFLFPAFLLIPVEKKVSAT